MYGDDGKRLSNLPKAESCEVEPLIYLLSTQFQQTPENLRAPTETSPPLFLEIGRHKDKRGLYPALFFYCLVGLSPLVLRVELLALCFVLRDHSWVGGSEGCRGFNLGLPGRKQAPFMLCSIPCSPLFFSPSLLVTGSCML